MASPWKTSWRALRRLVEDFPEVELVYPVHLSPVVQEVAHRHLLEPRTDPSDRRR